MSKLVREDGDESISSEEARPFIGRLVKCVKTNGREFVSKLTALDKGILYFTSRDGRELRDSIRDINELLSKLFKPLLTINA